MGYLIDTHCHLHDRETYEFALGRSSKSSAEDIDPEKILTRARAAGVLQLICIGTSHEDSLQARDFAAQHDDVFWTYGIHPDEAGNGDDFLKNIPQRPVQIDNDHNSESEVTSSARNMTDVVNLNVASVHPLGRVSEAKDRSEKKYPHSPVAIGEVGLDYRDGTNNREAQIRLFEEMLQLATDHNLPLVFHVREAFDDFFAVLHNFPERPAVVHSFSDSPENLHKSLDHNFYIGVNGLVTFAELPTPPLAKILLETDAPFLTPVPNRGKINESAFVKDIAHYLASKLGVSDAEIADITTKNARELFRLPGAIVRSASV